MKNLLKILTKNWIDNNSGPAIDFSSRSISKYKTGCVALIGMRKLGKTEYLKFRYQEFLRVNKKSSFEAQSVVGNKDLILAKKVLFVDFDSLMFSSIDFSRRESNGFIELTTSLMEIIEVDGIELVLIDEIQSRIDWTRWLKGMIDHFPNTTFIVTCSDEIKMNGSGQHGGLRFKNVFIGPITYKEYLSSHRFSGNQDESIVGYFDYVVHPTGALDGNVKALYASVIEKQITQSNIRSSNIQNVFRAVCLNPGRDINSNAVANTTKIDTDSKIDNKQTKAILDFLVESKLIIRLENLYTKQGSGKRSEYKYYPLSWNSYKFFTTHQSVRELNQDTIPKAEFVFENVVISNVISSLHHRLDIYLVSYMDDKKGKKSPLVVMDMFVEIKAIDLSQEENHAILKLTVDKMKQFKNSVIVHTGKTFVVDNIKIYDSREFLARQPWIDKLKHLEQNPVVYSTKNIKI